MKQFDIITIFPDILESYFNESLFKRAQKNKLIKIKTHFLRKWAKDRHQTVDDKPYGGGVGLVFKADIILKALNTINKFPPLHKGVVMRRAGASGASADECDPGSIQRCPGTVREGYKKTRIILTAANGKRFTQKDAKRLSEYERLIFVCPRYEGIDARVEKIVDEKISIGDYVLAGGELAAAVIIEAVSRYIPGFVGKQESVASDSFFQEGYLEFPQYTRPEVIEYKGKKLRVPKVLLSGDHGKIAQWRKKKSKNF
ncbi:tRNA (guanosine(37)-N1)-methyltransferase TrmD [Candidatus Falkowbacteria bacterium]|nr:tRNA (guanosine(37)-N1)-methyltransferase TrmD [Candidatus Falkowbacteria bacterium]